MDTKRKYTKTITIDYTGIAETQNAAADIYSYTVVRLEKLPWVKYIINKIKNLFK